MKYISKKNGVVYNTLNESVIKFHINDLQSLIIAVNDDRALNHNERLEVIDDFTKEEARAGLNEVKKALNGTNNELLKAYTSFYIENIKDEAEALSVAKELKKAEIDKKRDAMIESGVEYKGKMFQSAEKDRNLLTSTTSLFSITKQVPENFVWIAKNNEAVPFTLQDLIALGGLMATSVNQNTIKARELKDRVEKATNKAEVLKIAWA